jgi:hypothetical protein
MPKPEYSRESREEGRMVKTEERREHGERMARVDSGQHLKHLDGEHAPKPLHTEGTHNTKPGLLHESNFSRARSSLEEQVERGKHGAMVCGEKIDSRHH